MVVVMQERATRGADPGGDRAADGDGLRRAPVDGRVAHGHRRRRRRHAAIRSCIEVQDGVHEVLRITEPYKLASRTFKPENTVITIGDVRIGGDEVIVMAGPVLGRDRRAGRGDGGGGQARGREGPARRRVQAAQLALQLPGPRRGGPADAARARPIGTT